MHQPKLDGYRLQAITEARTVRLYTKGGHDWTERLAGLAEALKGLPARSAIVDGEIVLADAAGLPDFVLLHKTKGRRRGAELHMYAFDLLHRAIIPGWIRPAAVVRAIQDGGHRQ